MSGSRSLISTIARSIRSGTKYGPPQWMSEMCAIVKRRLAARHRRSVSSGRRDDEGVRRRCYLACRWPWKRLISRHIGDDAAALRQRGGTRVREDPRLLRRPVDVRAAHVRARARRGRPRRRGVHARLLPPGAGPVPRGHGDEAVARDAQEPQAAQAPASSTPTSGSSSSTSATSSGSRSGTASKSPRSATAPELDDARIGEVYLDAGEIAARVGELGAEIARDYAGREPLLDRRR